MKKNFLILLIILSSTGFAQEKKLHFGLNLYPNLSVPFVVTNSTAPVSNPSIGYNYTSPAYSAEKFSFSASFFAQYELTERFKLTAGLGYMNNGSTTKINTNVTTALPVVAIQTPLVNQHHLEIPLNFQLYFGKRFYYTAGISPVLTFLSTSTVEKTTTTGTTNETTTIKSDFYRTFNLYANMGFGVDYIKKDKFSLYLQPHAQYGFLGVGKNVPQNMILFSFGLATGIRI